MNWRLGWPKWSIGLQVDWRPENILRTDTRLDLWEGKIAWEGNGCSPVFLPGEFSGLGSLAGYSPWGREESDGTEQLALPLFPLGQRELSLGSACLFPAVVDVFCFGQSHRY